MEVRRAEGVPLDINDDDLKNDLDMLFSDTTFVRMTKGPTKQRLRTVKIFCKTPEDLTKAATIAPIRETNVPSSKGD